tara:strand:- start:1652 stop:2377 length:726 start_codon:yes stop_codon:yes gene_type:complete
MVYMFDIDGTLTYPLQKMGTDLTTWFLSWMNNKKVYLVGGSDKNKIDRQIPASVGNRCMGIFSCMGNELWKGGEIVYENSFNPPPQLTEMLISFQMYTKFPVRCKIGGRGKIIEHRTGMLNFTTIGRNADEQERLKYYEWDKENGERKLIAEAVEKDFPELEAKVGGQISIDIQPKGYNKSQASKWVREKVDKDIVFIGDKCSPKGNDYDIYIDVLNNGGKAFETSGPRETMSILERKINL